MSIEIRMPRLVDTMTQGSVVAWRKREGEPVQAGEVIAEIEADKATVDLESPGDGTLARIIVAAGAENVAVGQVLAILAPAGQAVADPMLEPAPGPSAPARSGQWIRGPVARHRSPGRFRAGLDRRGLVGRDRHQSPGGEHGTTGRARYLLRSRQRSGRPHHAG